MFRQMTKEKESGLTKLIELLNEYGYGVFVYEYGQLRFRMGSKVKILAEPILISKSFGFIKWLVENEKIDREKNVLAFEFSSVYTYEGEDYEDHLKECKLLMLLSIQDEPIEFLVSILK